MMDVKTILHPTDFSADSRCAFELACAIARERCSKLIVLHVAGPAVPGYGEAALLYDPEETYAAFREELGEVKASDCTPKVEHRFVIGDPAREIVRVAEEAPADLIVMGTRGRSGLTRLVMGSVAEHVLRKAPCPVLTVKATDRVPPAAQKTPEHAVAVWGD
jgi:nucleotide-binding universal stress UspA family protein